MMNPAMRLAGDEQRAARAWDVLHTVLDPEVPALSVCDLGIVRDVVAHPDGVEVVLTPTYSGCPATEVIERSVIDAVNEAGLGPARVTLQRAPAWTTDWISESGKRKLREYGIAPPSGEAAVNQDRPIRLVPRHAIECPRQQEHRAPVGLRLHRVQVALPLRGLPRTLRILQAVVTL